MEKPSKKIELKNEDEKQKKPSPEKNKPVNIIMALSLAFITVLVMLVITVAGNMFENHSRQAIGNIEQGRMMDVGESRQRGGMAGGGMHRFFSNDSSKSVISGVVTSVSDNSFVIGGNGTQYTVKTTDDTTYNTTGKTVSKNDSVTITGTLSDKTITATSVQIQNF